MSHEEVRLHLAAPMSSRGFVSLYGRYTMNAPASITITPVRVADLLAEGERMPVYVHVIDHPDACVLVDTGMAGSAERIVRAAEGRFGRDRQSSLRPDGASHERG